MPLKDRNIAWQRKSRFITAGEILAGGFADASGAATGFGTGGPILTEVPGESGVSMGFGVMNINGAGNFFHALDFVTPREMDIEEEIGFRVHYMTLGTVATTDDITFIVQYSQCDVGEQCVSASTPLDTPITEHRQGVALSLVTHRTARGIINAGKFDETARHGMIHWEVEADAMDYSANEIGVLGFEIDYMPRLTWSNSEPLGESNKNLAAA